MVCSVVAIYCCLLRGGIVVLWWDGMGKGDESAWGSLVDVRISDSNNLLFDFVFYLGPLRIGIVSMAIDGLPSWV